MEHNFERDFARQMLRSNFVSLFASALKHRKTKTPSFGLVALARSIGKDKATLSRDFGGSPNWRLDTVADIAEALDLDLKIEAVDRASGVVIRATGPVSAVVLTTDGHTSSRKLVPLRSQRDYSFDGELAA